jgi:hypothetical protein
VKISRRPTIREIIRWQVENDPQTIKDQQTMMEKWGIDVRPRKKAIKLIKRDGLWGYASLSP